MKNKPDVVMDTVSIHHILRQPKHVAGGRLETALDEHFKSGRLRIALDKSRGLLSEWERTCGIEAISVVLPRWEALQVVVIIDDLRVIPQATGKKLRDAGFHDAIDRLVLRIALSSDHIVVSNDSDFWDPADPKSLGNPKAPVAQLCREHLNVEIVLLVTLLQLLGKDKLAPGKKLNQRK